MLTFNRIATAALLPGLGFLACGRVDTASVGTSSGLVSPGRVWRIEASGVSLEVRTAPYRVSVLDAQGRVRLSSNTSDKSARYSAVSWATGSVEYAPLFIAGYTEFKSGLERHRAPATVVDFDQSPHRLRVTLSSGVPGAPKLEVVHSVRPHAARVEARVLGPAPRAWSAAFRVPSDQERFVGFGERFNTTNQRGKRVWSWIEEGGIGTGEGHLEGQGNPFPSGELMTYYAVPFFLSTEGYGFWLDTTYRSEFELASDRADAWRAWHVGPELAYEVYVPDESDQRPWPYQIIDHFTAATGRPMLPPAWAFGPRRRVGRRSMRRGTSEVQAMRDLDLAVTAVDDAVHFYPWGTHRGREASLRSWVREASELGYRVNAYYNSFVDRSPLGPLARRAAAGQKAGHFLTLEGGTFPDIRILSGGRTPSLFLVDFTSEAAAQWYADSFQWALELGYSGWMYDFGEYVPAKVRSSDGMSGERLHNLYPRLYAKTLHDALEATPQAGDWLAFMRSGYTGSSAYVPFVWSGDPAASFDPADGLPSMVPAGLNLGVSGAPHFGGDIGGFHCLADGPGAADAELLVRWVQMGAMTSNMMDQSACVGALGARKTDIWSDERALLAWRKYARLHTRLQPYLYSLAHEATRTGKPVMRLLFLEHPKHPALADVDDAYYFGPSLYVAPVLERGARSVERLLPPGSFLEWDTGRVLEGNPELCQRRILDAPLMRLPLFLREDSLVPLLDRSIDTLADEDSTDIVGPGDVAGVYDVRGFLTGRKPAAFTVWDGSVLSAQLGHGASVGGIAAAAAAQGLSMARAVGAFESCDECFLVHQLEGGVARLRVATRRDQLQLGGVRLSARSQRRIRWDLHLRVSPNR